MEKIKNAPNEFILGEYSITLKAFRIVVGHDDSLPFVANVYVNNKLVCGAYNDGWGGEAVLEMNPKNEKLLESVIHKANGTPFEIDGKEYGNWTLPMIVDDIACRLYDDIRLKKEVKAKQKYRLFFKHTETEASFSISIKNSKQNDENLTTLIKTKSGKKYIKSVIEKYKKQNYELVNTNLVF